MISYRKLAMRVLGHPLRVPTNTPRPASHRVTALALTAAMVAGMAAPAYAGTYYIGDGDITITKDEKGDVYVKHADNKDKSNGDVDNGDIIIKGGTPVTSAAKSASATLKVEDRENEDKDMVYPGDTKGSDSSEGGSEEKENQSTEKNQTGDTTGGKNTGAGSSDPEGKGSEGGDADSGTGGDGIHSGSVVNIAGGTINTTGGSGKSGGAGVSTESGIVSIGNSDTPLDLTATAPDADNAIQGRDGKKPDEIIHLEENGKPGLVKLVENGVTRLFHNGVYTKSIYPAGSETHPLGDWVITKKPTCTEKGERQRSCKVEHCVVTETEELPALGHQ